MKTFCILCMGTYVSVLGIFLTSGASPSIPCFRCQSVCSAICFLPEEARSFHRGAADCAGTGSAMAVFPKDGARPQAKRLNPPTTLPMRGSNSRVPIWHPCRRRQSHHRQVQRLSVPSCRITHEWYQPVLEKFEQTNPGGEVRPQGLAWNTKCNNNAQTLHPGRVKRRLLSDRAGPGQGQGTRNGGLAVRAPAAAASAEEVKASAQKILGISDFDQQYQQKLPDIRRDIADGVALGISGTPTFFINGVRLYQSMPRHTSNSPSSSS
jgi:hypothetical protein